MAPERRQRWLLGVLGVVAVIGAIYWLRPEPAASLGSSSNPRTGGRGSNTPAAVTAPDVHLQALKDERPKPAGVDRNLFRFKARAAPAPPRVETQPGPPVPVTPIGPPPPAPLPPITLKYIGVISVEASGRKIAGLFDGRQVWPASEGDVILGQYKILRIGAESIEMSYLDGRGRQTIRLSGS
jgi:hypothetical protein